MTKKQYRALKIFLCNGIICSKCPFFESNDEFDRCLFNVLFFEKDVDPKLFTIVKKNKAYFNRCKELNSEYWDTVKALFGATLK